MSDLRKAAEIAYEVMTDINQVCEGANHKRKDMHPYGDDCPIQKRFDDAWEALRQALAQPDEVSAEREACAKVCDELDKHPDHLHPADCAEAIRARSEK